MYSEIKSCRICGNRNLVSVLDLGDQALTGVFPRAKSEAVGRMPLELVKCHGDENQEGKTYCGLLQLRHTGNLSEFYGMNYGYRSGLNKSMVAHLHEKVRKILNIVELKKGDLVVDIGSNDSSLLQGFPRDAAEYVGIDPTGVKFKKYYPDHISLIPDFFTAKGLRAGFGDRKARVITSISMFYDLEEPQKFMQEVHDCLADDGLWVFEQSYLPTMLEKNSYDTVCHEHLEYYALHQIKWMADRVGLRILDVEFNDINGGSFSIQAVKQNSSLKGNPEKVESTLRREREIGLHTLRPYEEFRNRIVETKAELREFLSTTKKKGQKIFGYGASTKGNVLLQYCGLTEAELPYIAEVNPDKFGSFTPGTLIPIISEEEAKRMRPDFFLVLPWHFRENILSRERDWIAAGGKFVFPLARVEAVPCS